jgi:SET domain-containing protein
MSHYRPLPDELTLDESKYLSDITGKREIGLFAQEKIPAGTRWISHIKTKDPKFLEHFPDGLVRLPLGGYFNHDSENFNCKVVHTEEDIHLEALRDIESGEELTAKYTLYDPS